MKRGMLSLNSTSIC